MPIIVNPDGGENSNGENSGNTDKEEGTNVDDKTEVKSFKVNRQKVTKMNECINAGTDALRSLCVRTICRNACQSENASLLDEEHSSKFIAAIEPKEEIRLIISTT